MKKMPFLLLIVLIALQTPAFAKDLKVAVLDLNTIFVNSLAGKHGLNEVMQKTAKLRQEYTRTQAARKTMIEDYKKQQSALSLENRRLKELEIKRNQTELEELAATVRQADNAARKELLPPIHRFLEESVQKYLASKEFDLVIDASRGAVILTANELIVTQEVMNYCDEQWKAKGN